jgi:invasion protein IalB
MPVSRHALPAGKRTALAAAILGATALIAATSRSAPAQAPESSSPAAWRVECTGDGKTLDCRAVQQVFHRETRQLSCWSRWWCAPPPTARPGQW